MSKRRQTNQEPTESAFRYHGGGFDESESDSASGESYLDEAYYNMQQPPLSSEELFANCITLVSPKDNAGKTFSDAQANRNHYQTSQPVIATELNAPGHLTSSAYNVPNTPSDQNFNQADRDVLLQSPNEDFNYLCRAYQRLSTGKCHIL